MNKEFSDTWKLVRYTLASPFSRTYSAKRRWLRERDEWERLGIAATDMERKVYVAPRTGAVCITVSKSANTTLKYMLYPPEKGEPRNAHSDDHMLTRLTDTGRTLNDLKDGSHRIFTFVRHPVSRFWSCYDTRVAGRAERSPIVRAVAAHFGVAPRDDFHPEMVLGYIRDTSPVVLDEHIRPQWACTGVERIPINFVGRVESMKEDVLKLREMGYFDDENVKRYRHLNQSSSREKPRDERINDMIREVYAKDMELFGYE